ncbi:copper resistance CopC family protein [Cognaticolwellia beringensis]|uniref:Copper resistance protein C n=1 Tax=Cognaticolwellia beringensis TaxID=1967665 RepID=A0A222G6Z4_9GAMM|nr:copper resistance CopC family protein [Cognaticolwellia beringensis]ASP47667.1 copper resistance protein CopC [Cognaticolwellia beringensis]
MKFFNTVAAFLSLTLAFSASAHISLTESAPANEAMLMQSPEQLSLTFSGEVRLAKVVLTDADNQPVDFSFKPSSKPNMAFSWPLPTLSKGKYTAKWIALGGDGHKMTGTFNFMVGDHGAHDEMKKEMSSSHSQHSH